MSEGFTLERIDECRWIIPRGGAMRTEGMIYADEEMLEAIKRDQSLQQVRNVACMPDIHWGYGFPIGGVAAFDEAEGVISPGGVGYDIN